MTRRGKVSVAATLAAMVAVIPAAVRATEASPETAATNPASPPPPAPAPAPWFANFATARMNLQTGRFAEAAAAFAELEATAPGPGERAVCAELRQLASAWAARGLTLVEQAAVGEGDFSAKAVDRRSSGEIATLYLAAVSYGLGTGGYLAVLAEPDSISGVTVPLLVMGAAMPLAVYLVDRASPFRYGTPSAISAGLAVGALEGALWTSWYQAQADRVDEVSVKTAATLVWVPTTLGALAGGVLGEKVGTTPGRAELLAAAGGYGAAVTGLTVSSIVDDDHEADEVVLLSAAVAANVGLVGGYLLGQRWSPGVARVRYIQLGGVSGGLGTGLLYLTIADKDSDGRAFGALTAAGMVGGLALATWLTADMPPDRRPDDPASTPAAPAQANLLISPTPDGGLTLGAFGVF